MAFICHCGEPARYRTAWMDIGRHYRICRRKPEDGGCNFFEFVQTDCCPRCCKVIPGLIRRLDAQHVEIMRLGGNDEVVTEMQGLPTFDAPLGNNYMAEKVAEEYEKELTRITEEVKERVTSGWFKDEGTSVLYVVYRSVCETIVFLVSKINLDALLMILCTIFSASPLQSST